MGSFLSYVLTYLVGGVTFIPLIVFTIWYTSKKVPESVEQRNIIDKEKIEAESVASGKPKGYRDLKAGEILDRENSGLKTTYADWITVTKEFVMFPQINPNDFTSNNLNSDTLESTNNSSGSITQNNGTGIFQKIIKGTSSSSNNLSSSNYNEDDIKYESQDPASIGSAKLRQLRKRNRFYGVIKHGNLFLYPDETQNNTKFAISLDKYIVNIWPRNLTDGQLFAKRSSIVLIKKEEFFQTVEKTQLLIDILKHENLDIKLLPKTSYYVYGDTSFEKENWYFTLLRASVNGNEFLNKIDSSNIDLKTLQNQLNPSIMAKPLYYNTADMLDLIETLNATENQLTTQWLNALIGRLFLATYKTEEFKEAFELKVEQKLKKIRTPGFLDQLQIHRIDVGHSAPMFTNPKLKKLSPDGNLEISMDMLYQGKVMLEIGTKLFLNIGVGFKQRQFDIIVKLTVNRIEGELLLTIKPQPSSRIWYTFSKMPEIDLVIEPVFSSRNASYGIITSILESKFKDAIKTSLVYPFYDDFVFYRSPNEIFRGGIFDKSVRVKNPHAESQAKKMFQSQSDSITSTLDNEKDIEFDPIKPSNASIGSKVSNSTSVDKYQEAQKVNTIQHPAEIEQEIGIVKLNAENDYENTEQTKTTVLKSYNKFKQWYKKAPIAHDITSVTNSNNPTSSLTAPRKHSGSNSSTTAKDYNPPEMISNRRVKVSKVESPKESNDTILSNNSFQLLSSNVNVRPSADAFINLDRKGNGSQTTRFGSISSMDDRHQSPKCLSSSPVSPEMFINEKFKTSTTGSSHSIASAEFGSNKNIIVPQVLTFNSISANHNMSLNNEPINNQLQASPIRAPIPEHEDDNYGSHINDGDLSNLHKTATLKRKPPPLPPKDTKT